MCGDRELVHHLAGLDRRPGGRGQRQRVPDAGRHLPGPGRARRGELDPGRRPGSVAPTPGPGGKRGIQLSMCTPVTAHAGSAQQLRRDCFGGLGMGMAAIPAEQAVALRPVQPHREGPAAGVVGQHRSEGGARKAT